jgi:hypothetical protein
LVANGILLCGLIGSIYFEGLSDAVDGDFELFRVVGCY